MATHSISRRIQYIIQYVNDFSYPSKKKIMDFLNEKDFNVSSRTLELDIERIRANFGLEITYSKEQNDYAIKNQKPTADRLRWVKKIAMKIYRGYETL